MSHQATAWAFAQRGLSPATKIVLLYLADRHNPDHGCFPSQARLAADCEMHRSSVNRHLKELVQAGLIRREERFDKETGRQLSTRYLLGFEIDQARPAAARRDTAAPVSQNETPPVLNCDTPCSTGETPPVSPVRHEPVRLTRKGNGKVTTKPPTEEFSENWRPDAEFIAWAQAQGFTSEEIEEQTRRWIQHWRAKGKRPGHPIAKSWRGWMQLELDHKAKRKGASPARDDVGKKWRDRIERKYGASAPGGA